MTNGCRVLLLRLSDGMDAKGIVSIPRTTLAADLGVDPARITENMKLARKLGFLDIVRRARPGVTAVYQAVVPNYEGAPQRTPAQGALARRSQGAPQRTPTDAVGVRSDPHPSSTRPADGIPPSAGPADAGRDDTYTTATAVPAKPEHAVATATPPEAEASSGSSVIHPPKSKSRPWAQLQRDCDEERIDGDDLLEAIEDAVGGFVDGVEERTATGMVANGAKAIVIRNRILRDRKDEYAAVSSHECLGCRRPFPHGTEPPQDRTCHGCARSMAS